MDKRESIRKILRLFYSYDGDFIIDWPQTRRKGFSKYLLKMVINYSTIWCVLGFFFIVEKRRFCGVEGWNILSDALIIGFIIGVSGSFLAWGLNNNRYNNLKEKIPK